LDSQSFNVDAVIARRDVLSLLVDGHVYEIKREQTATELHMWVGSACFTVELRDPRSLRTRQKTARDDNGPRKILAPMPGRIVRLLVAENSEVEAGQGIVVVEAMKMQNEIKSPKKGVVKKISATPGAAVNPGDVLAIVE
jgi:biotin carboxyl carrier protein